MRRALLIVAGLLCAASAAAAEAVAVVGSDLKPYREALAGFEETFGAPVDAVSPGRELARRLARARLAVAFGGKAALQPFPRGMPVIYCLAPGVTISDPRAVKISVLPDPSVVVSRIKAIAPDVRRLAVLWSSPAFEDYVSRLEIAAPSAGMTLLVERVRGAEDLPDALRRVKGKADGVWTPLDPALLNSYAISTLKEFAWSNHLPYIAPSDSLADRGASAAVSVSFREMGRTAGRVARRALAGEPLPPQIFPESSVTTINKTAAAESGLRLTEQTLKGADRVLP